MAISDTWLKANSGKPCAIREEKSDRDGLSVRITPKGKITFQLRFRYDARPCRLDLGTYPLMSLKDARAESQRLRAQLEQGHDPRVVRQLEKQTILQADSIESLFRQWYVAYCKGNKKGHHEILRSFEIHVRTPECIAPRVHHASGVYRQVLGHQLLNRLNTQDRARG